LQVLQTPHDEDAQHTVFTQLPVTQVVPLAQDWPLMLLHAPLPSQALLPTHAFAGKVSWVPLGMFVHAPKLPATLHA